MFLWEEPLKVLHAGRHAKLYMIRYNVTNVTRYTYYNAYFNVCYNATIRYDITVLMTLFDALLIGVGVCKLPTMFSRLIPVS